MSLSWSLKNTGAHLASPSYCRDFKRFLNRLYASCHYGVPYTTDGGTNWTMTNERPNGTGYYCRRLIVHNGRLFASGIGDAKATVYYTDNGIDWTTKIVGTASRPMGTDFYAIDSRLFMGVTSNIAYGTTGRYYYTDNGGGDWFGVSHPMRSCYAMIEYSGKFYICGQYNNSDKRDSVYYTVDPISPGWVNASTGLSVANNNNVVSMQEFAGNLYCCDSSGHVYKLVTATSWVSVFSGLDNCRHLEVFYEKLYVCGDSANIGESSVYSTGNGIIWQAEGITAYSTDVYGIWGDTVESNLWAGTINSRAWVAYISPPLPKPPVPTESQGTRFRRASTVLVNSSDSTTMEIKSTAIECTGVIDFVALGFTTNMLIICNAQDTNIYAIKDVVATAIAIYGDFSATGSTNIIITGYNMGGIGEVTKFGGLGSGSVPVIDITPLGSNSQFPKLKGLPDEGQLSLTLNYNATDTGQKGLKSDRVGRVRNLYDILFTDIIKTDSAMPSRAAFFAYSKNFMPSGAVNGKVSANSVLEITGAVQYSTKVTT